MESTDSSRIVAAAKAWIATQTGLGNTVLHIFQFEKKGSDYEVGVEGTAGGATKRYLVTVNAAGAVIGHREAYSGKNGGENSTLILIAFVFSILTLVAFGIYAVVLLGIALAPGIGTFALLALIPLVFFAVGLYCFVRINRIRIYYNAGKYREAYQENSVGLGILTLIFNGVVAGVLLLVARSSMEH